MSELQDDDDDQLAERLADLWVEWARQPGVHRLRALQAAGLLPETPTLDQQAAPLGITTSQAKRLSARAFHKLRRALRAAHKHQP